MKVFIPFKDMFRELMLTGTKTMTSRTRKYGEIGDIFQIFGTTFEIVNVCQKSLDVVAWLHYREEGAESPSEFMKGWATIHPIKGYVPTQQVWVHQFRRTKS